MTKVIGNSETIDTWASSGNKIEPPLAKTELGWVFADKPPFEFLNFLQATFGEKINHILKNGIPLWNAENSYELNDFVKFGDTLWRCLAANQNSQPDLGNTDWLRYPGVTINLWNNLTTYQIGEFVFHDFEIWKVLISNTASEPMLGNTDWLRYPDFSLNEYEPGTEYQINRLVHKNGNIYRALTVSQNSDPELNPSDWELYVPSPSTEADPETLVERDSGAQSKFGTPTHEQHVIRPVDYFSPTTLTQSDFQELFPGSLPQFGYFELTPAMGQHIKIDFDTSTGNRDIYALGTSCPVGWTVTLEIVRKQPLTGTGISDTLGGRKTFRHLETFDANGLGILDHSLYEWVDDGSVRRNYHAYPDASSKQDDALCLKEILTYQYVGVVSGQPTWVLRELPKSKRYSRGNNWGSAHAELHPDGFVDFSQKFVPATGSTARQDILFSMAHFVGVNWAGNFEPSMSSFMYLNQSSGFAAAVKDEIRHMVWGWNVSIETGWSITPFVPIGGFRVYLFSARGRWKPTT